MSKKMHIMSILGSLVAVIAMIASSSASLIIIHQPRTPKSLLK